MLGLSKLLTMAAAMTALFLGSVPAAARSDGSPTTARRANYYSQIGNIDTNTSNVFNDHEFTIADTGADPQRQKWKAHGILMGMAWIFCAPVAVATSLARSIIPIDGLWLKIHRRLMCCCALFTFIAFCIAVAATNQGGVPKYNGRHQRIGLCMFLFLWIQVPLAYLRPDRKKDKTRKDAVTGAVNAEKSIKRFAWEAGHKILGTILFVFGMYNTYTGPKLYAARAGLSYDAFLTAWWVWFGVLMGLAVIIRLRYFWIKNRKLAEVGDSILSRKRRQNGSNDDNSKSGDEEEYMHNEMRNDDDRYRY